MGASVSACVSVSVSVSLHVIWTSISLIVRWPGMNRMWVRMGQELQHDKEKLLRRVLECSDPKRGLELLKTDRS